MVYYIHAYYHTCHHDPIIHSNNHRCTYCTRQTWYDEPPTTITHGERFYAAMYASRALPLGLLTVVAPFTFNGSALQLVFAAASLAQIGDVVIGLKKQEWGMVIAPAILATIYLAAAWLLA